MVLFTIVFRGYFSEILLFVDFKPVEGVVNFYFSEVVNLFFTKILAVILLYLISFIYSAGYILFIKNKGIIFLKC